jgi:hypothetical protein
MDDIGVQASSSPTVGQMMARDLISLMFILSSVVMTIVVIVLPTLEPEDPSEALDIGTFYFVLVADVAIALGMIYYRWSIYSSVLSSGVETPGEVTSVTSNGDAITVEFTYRWQAETVKSTGKMGGYIPKQRVKYEVGLKATLLVDQNKPKRFLVLDTVR